MRVTAKQMPVREGVQPYDVMHRIADVGNDVMPFDVEGWWARTSRDVQGVPDSRQFGVALSRIGFGF